MNKNDGTSTEKTETPSRLWPKILFFFIAITSWYGLSRLLPLEAWLLNLLTWIEGRGFWGLLIFILLYIPACVFMFPDIFPNAAAGAIWGIGIGTAVTLLGRVLGSSVTFLLTRNIAGRWLERKMDADPKFAAIAEAIGREGFRIVVLLRLCPIFPSLMLNYAFGLTRISLKAAAAGTLIGMIPRTLFVAYVGAGTRNLADIAAGEGTRLTTHPILFCAGFILSLAILIILAAKARRLINEATR